MTRGERANALFYKGYNCAQAVVCSFCEELHMTAPDAARLASGFGGGMGRLREVCGAVSGMVLVANLLYGDGCEKDYNKKKEHYARVQALAGAYRAQTGSIVCRELLGLKTAGADAPQPEKRTAEYYKKRPCPQLCALAADILDDYLQKDPPQNAGAVPHGENSAQADTAQPKN